jgi:WD40 repeat protein
MHEIVPMQLKKKHRHEFQLFLVQDIKAHSDSIWVAKFSPCGMYLATGGKDAVLKIWQIGHIGSIDHRDNDYYKVF